jgi:uncharacterized membrane protein
MLAIAQNLEQAGSNSDLAVLVILAVVVLLGLFIWLAGLGIKNILFPVIGILLGGTVGYLITRGYKLALVLALFGLLLAFILAKKISALSVKSQTLWAFIFSLCGTIIIFVGMILLLVYKGAEPIKTITQKPPFFIALFAAMTLFGTIIQSIFSKKPKNQSKNNPNADTN